MNDSTKTLPTNVRRSRLRLVVGAAVALALLAMVASLVASRSRASEISRLAGLLGGAGGAVVGEIGAGTGWLSVEIAERVGPSGRVYATELNPARLEDIRAAAAARGLTNLTVVEAGTRVTNLPAGCCDAIFMRRVYHHLDEAPSVLASIREALRPGGRLVIIEFGRSGVLGSLIHMGTDPDVLVDSVSASGFTHLATEAWPGWDHYVAVFDATAVDGAAPRGARR
jgi:ubiquinone/menaquinone biosynthesis C-methylase UbiE